MGQKVHVNGKPGVYIVVRVNRERRVADVMLATGKHGIEEQVPFGSIRPARSETDPPEDAFTRGSSDR